ncbi:MAG TPA: glycosyltransferase family 1 protein [Candidatus Angelobacter sp.]|nr:glycosyltransferase family 1 protein [Candidatus Angelobacter sp.]
MKIALDLRRIKNPGIGRYMRCLTEALLGVAPEHEYLLILPPDYADNIRAPGHSIRVEKIISAAGYYSIREQIELPRMVRQHRVDLLHSPHFNIPLMCPCPVVATIHDVIYLACAEDLPSVAGRLYYKGMMAAAVRRADRIVAVSSYSRDEIRRYLNTEREIEVIHSGVDRCFQPVTDQARIQKVKAKYGIAGEYLLYTGIFKPRKNHRGLLEAFKRFLGRGGRAALVIAGPVKEGEEELRKLADELRISHQVTFTGFVDDADLPALYSGASVYACPSLYEGFGLTVLEAMACGTAVVCSPATSLPEVAGAAALYADGRNAVEFGDALYHVFTDLNLRAGLVEKGYVNVGRFDWHETAQQTLAIYQRALGAPAGKVVCA